MVTVEEFYSGQNVRTFTVRIDGEFRDDAVKALENLVLSRTYILLSLKRARWVSLKMLKNLVGILKSLHQVDGDLYLVTPNSYMKSLMELTGTANLFQIFETLEEALVKLREELSGK